MDQATVDALLDRVRQLADERRASALVQAHDEVAEVSVAPGRWVVRSHSVEHVGGENATNCWQIVPAGGARPVHHDHPADWVHPMVGLLWPQHLPVWGRPGDRYRPVRVIEGLRGPGQLVLKSVRTLLSGEPPTPMGTLELDPVHLLCTRLELSASTWTLQEYHAG